MPWKLTDVVPPIPPEVQDVADGLSTVIGGISPLLNTTASLLDAASAFFVSSVDPYKSLMSALLVALENLVNDYFGSGAHELVVDPFGIVGPAKRLGVTSTRKIDKYGIPYLTPAMAINYAIQSLDDTGDEKRPQYSSSAQISAFGFMLTAVDAGGLIDLIKALLSVWSIDDMSVTLRKYERLVDGIEQSTPPDWNSLQFNQIEQIGQLQKEIVKIIQQAQGYLVTADEVLRELIAMLQRKVEQLQASLEGLQSVLEALSAIADMNDVWAFDLPLTTGGTEKLKRDLLSEDLSALKLNKYSYMVLYVGGGPVAPVVDNIRKLVV